MALTDGDKKWITENTTTVVIDVLEKVVIPQFTALEERMTKKIVDKVGGLEVRLGRRIDNVAKVVTENKMDHEKRIVKVENHLRFTATSWSYYPPTIPSIRQIFWILMLHVICYMYYDQT